MQVRTGGVIRSTSESQLTKDWVAKMDSLAKATAVVMVVDDSETGVLRLVDPLLLIPSKVKPSEETALKKIWKASKLHVATMYTPRMGSPGWTDTNVDLFMGDADLLGASLEWLMSEMSVPMFSLQLILQADDGKASVIQTPMATPDPTPRASRFPLALDGSAAAAAGGASDSDPDSEKAKAKAMAKMKMTGAPDSDPAKAKAMAKIKMTGAGRLLKQETAKLKEAWQHGKANLGKKKVSHLYTSNHQVTCSDARCVHCSCCVRRKS